MWGGYNFKNNSKPFRRKIITLEGFYCQIYIFQVCLWEQEWGCPVELMPWPSLVQKGSTHGLVVVVIVFMQDDFFFFFWRIKCVVVVKKKRSLLVSMKKKLITPSFSDDTKTDLKCWLRSYLNQHQNQLRVRHPLCLVVFYFTFCCLFHLPTNISKYIV